MMGVNCGNHGSLVPSDIVLIMGIAPFTEPVPLERRPVWVSNTRFSHFASPTAATQQQQTQRRNNVTGGSSTCANIKQQAEEAETEKAAVVAVLGAFSTKLELIFRLRGAA
jgi:hypothetical protein